jgi:hypothetical protein
MLDGIMQEQDLVEQMQRRWMIGNGEPPTADQLPRSWQSLLADAEPQKQVLFTLALSSQHQTWLFEAEKPGDLQSHPELPELGLPPLPNRLRPLFRRILETVGKQDDARLGHLLRLLLQRHCIAHPADWMPLVQNQDLPPIYWPWRRWMDSHGDGSGTADESERLTSDNWDGFPPSHRLALLRQMRNRDGAAARSLIMENAGNEAAEKRLKTIEVLAIGLNGDDADYLRQLTQDRSQKVRQLACQLLSRLGIAPRPTEEGPKESAARELAEYFELKKTGLLGRSRKVVPKNLKSNKQQSIRTEQLETVSLHDFAGALGLGLKELVSAWSFADNRPLDNHHFVMNAVGSLPDSELRELLEDLIQLMASEEHVLPLILLVVPRLQDEERSDLPYRLLKIGSADFNFMNCLPFINAPLNSMKWEDLLRIQAWKTLTQTIKENVKEHGYIENNQASQELQALGLMLPRETAQKILDTLAELGVPKSDPALNSLLLNAQLNDQAIQTK